MSSIRPRLALVRGESAVEADPRVYLGEATGLGLAALKTVIMWYRSRCLPEVELAHEQPASPHGFASFALRAPEADDPRYLSSVVRVAQGMTADPDQMAMARTIIATSHCPLPSPQLTIVPPPVH